MSKTTTLFSKDNLVPWSIVGFDVKERTPEERYAQPHSGCAQEFIQR